MRNYSLFIILLLSYIHLSAQVTTSENVIIVTLDGMRWQEIFQGADSSLTFHKGSLYLTHYSEKRFWGDTEEERRKKLMPFLWTEIASRGIIMGNRNYGNFFENANPYWFSYPGYNELFTGYPDTNVNSNEKIPNKNVTVLEYLNNMQEYKNKVAVFGSWDVFASIFNEARSGLLVNDGFRDLEGKLNERQKIYNRLQHEMPDFWDGSERLDAATFNIAFEYMKANKPKIMYFGFGETDEFAHSGSYHFYLDAAQRSDAFIRQIWEYLQSDHFYANKTTLIITTDHGRGTANEGKWKEHGTAFPGSNHVWMAAIGPSVAPRGEVKKGGLLYQGQIASTIAGILGKKYKPAHPLLPSIYLQ